MPTTFLEIDLNALEHNLDYLKSKLKAETQVMAVVKAFGYGSDAVEVALRLQKKGVAYFAVAYVREGVALRDGGITAPILVLHPQVENFDELIDRCLEPSIYSYRVLHAFIASAKAKKQQNYPIHLKFNTGLNRLGFKTGNTDAILEILKNTQTLKVKSLFSHLVASEDLNEKDFTQTQIASFKEMSTKMINGLGYTPLLHQSNTSAIINYPEAQFDMVRTGIGLYGYANTPEEDQHLMPVATLKTVISQIHDIKAGETVGYNKGFKATQPQKTATVPVGHADGIARSYGKGKGYFVIKGQKAPIVGNVCMDMTMINVTHIDCAEGDEVIVFGKGAPATHLADQIGSISYELLTAVSQRIKRVILR